MGAAPDRPLPRSQEYLRRAREVIPSCTQTFSKGYRQFVEGVAPVFLQRGLGSHVWDVDGHEYIDYIMALGPIVLGYDDKDVTAEVQAHIGQGVTLSLPHPLEVEVAELLTGVIPCAEMVRFAKNGSDATAGAVRAARAFTGRERIVCCGYHGCQDWFIGTTSRHRGVPRGVRELTSTFAYNDIASLRKLFEEYPGQIAGVMLEPVGVVEPEGNFLRHVAELTRQHGAVLIFDEIVTGLRVALGGAQEYFGVVPDLACFGKALANGYPLAAVVGKREIMEIFDEIFFSFTFGGEILSLAAARATIRAFQSRRVIDHLWRQGRRLQEGYNAVAASLGLGQITECIGLPPRTVLTFREPTGAESLEMKSLFQQEMIKRGILTAGGQNVSFSHDDSDIERTLAGYREALTTVADAIRAGDVTRRLEGRVVEPVFRQP